MNGIEYSAGLICDKISRKIPNSSTAYTREIDTDNVMFKTIIKIGDEMYYYAISLPVLHVVISHNTVADEIIRKILTMYPNLV